MLGKFVKIANHIGLDINRYNHRTRVAKDSAYAIATLLAKQEVRTIFDVGANIGQSALAYRKQFPKASIYSFEPAEATFGELKNNCRADKKMHPFQLAISDAHGKKEFFVNRDDTTSSLLEPSSTLRNEGLQQKLTAAGSVTVNCETLDSFCQKQQISGIDLLKMDIQGAELQAIIGAGQLLKDRKVGVVFCEVLFSPLYKKACDFALVNSAITQFNYSLYGLYNLNHFVDDGLMWADAIFVSPDLLWE